MQRKTRQKGCQPSQRVARDRRLRQSMDTCSCTLNRLHCCARCSVRCAQAFTWIYAKGNLFSTEGRAPHKRPKGNVERGPPRRVGRAAMNGTLCGLGASATAASQRTKIFTAFRPLSAPRMGDVAVSIEALGSSTVSVRLWPRVNDRTPQLHPAPPAEPIDACQNSYLTCQHWIHAYSKATEMAQRQQAGRTARAQEIHRR